MTLPVGMSVIPKGSAHFDEANNTITYIVKDPASPHCAKHQSGARNPVTSNASISVPSDKRSSVCSPLIRASSIRLNT